MQPSSIRVIDSHTGGEPTRVVVSGGPDLGHGSLLEQRDRFRDAFDWFRSTVVNEPRGSDVLVGALLTPPLDSTCVAGVIFFNNVGYLGMCGHGTIGLAITLAHLGRIAPGVHRLETPVGIVSFEYHGNNRVSVENVPSYRYLADVEIEVEGIGTVKGDVAWAGNWFYLVDGLNEPLQVAHAERLTDIAWRIRQALEKQGITGERGEGIDHIEIFGPPENPANHSRNFVLCPGKAYDRSPCGTGTSAKLACLYAKGKLNQAEVWRQESILGSVFTGSVRVAENLVYPRITGEAYITAEATLWQQSGDPLANGIRP
jgi:4-hydroxyproline epimerase